MLLRLPSYPDPEMITAIHASDSKGHLHTEPCSPQHNLEVVGLDWSLTHSIATQPLRSPPSGRYRSATASGCAHPSQGSTPVQAFRLADPGLGFNLDGVPGVPAPQDGGPAPIRWCRHESAHQPPTPPHGW